MNRSMIKARATMEQIRRGQMGQPAACKIDSNENSCEQPKRGLMKVLQVFDYGLENGYFNG